LFESYPDLQDRIPWISLGNLPTPIERMQNLQTELGHDNLWIKRDDLAGVRYGGNKLRKLEFIIADALKKQKKWILTFGGIGSNHCLATAIYGQEYGFKTVFGLIYQPLTVHVQKQLLRFHYYDAKVSYAKNTVGAVLKGLWHLATKRCVYFLGAGGSSVIGNLGYVEAALELADQIRQGKNPEPKSIFLPVGTMGTYAGMKIGLALAGIDCDLVGVRVTDEGMTNEKATLKLVNSTMRFLKKQSNEIPDIEFNIDEIHLEHGFAGPTYGSITEAGRKAVALIQEQEGIELETTYTGKALACMLNFIRKGDIKDGPVLFWNTYSSAQQPDDKISFEDHRKLPKSFHKFFKENLMSE
jgi:D-cysteine desulfhydrase